MIDPAIEHALIHLSRTPGLVVLYAPSREQARMALSRLGDRARELGLDVRLRFGFNTLERSDKRGSVLVIHDRDLFRTRGYPRPALELELTS